MNQNTSFKFHSIALLFALANGFVAESRAQPPAPPAAAPSAGALDPLRFQSTSFMRFKSSDPRGFEDFGIIQARTHPYQVLDRVTLKPILDPFTGQPRVLPSKAYLFEARNPLARVTQAGWNYALLEDRTLIAFSTIWDKPFPKGKLQEEIEVFGGVYMIKRGTREVISVSSSGYVNYATTVIAPAARLYGGNFFVDQSNDLWTVDYQGFVYNASKIVGIQFPGAKLAGGNYFVQQDGTVVTVSSDGIPLASFVPDSKPVQLGGNYYIGENGRLYTIRYDGVSLVGPKVAQKIKHLGSSYVIFADNSLMVVDGMGVVHQDVVRVESTKTKFQLVSKIPDAIDVKSLYTPVAR